MKNRPKWNSVRLGALPWLLLLAAGIIASISTVLGFCGRFGWIFDLFSHFRVQYFVGLVVVATLVLIPKQRKAAGVFACFALINLAVIAPLYFGTTVKVQAHGVGLKSMLINVNTRGGNPALVASIVRDVGPQILVLEEIDSRWLRELAETLRAYPYSCVQPRDDNFGIGLFSKVPLIDPAIVYIGDAEVPSVVANARIEATTVKIIATHPLPPTGGENSRMRDGQLYRIAEHIPRDGSPVVLLGDLNVTPWSHHFTDLLKRTGLRDSAKGRGVQPTWPADNWLLSIPLDHCLHSANVTILSRRIGPNVSSDHYPLIIEMAVQRKSE